MPIKYLDFDLLIERSVDRYRARVLDSPAGEASIEFAPPFSESEVDAFFVQIGQTRSFETQQTRQIQQFGQSLFEAVFSGPVRDRLRLSLGEANVQGAGLRIRLRLADTPELGNLPWEFIYDPGQNRFLALSVDTPVVRYLETQQLAQPFAVQPPLRILAMICGPKDFPRLDVDREWENLQASLKDLQGWNLVDLHRLSPPTLSALQQQLRRGQYHIFHFVGHGIFSKTDQDGFLLLENELGEGHRLSGRDLGTLLHDERSLRLVVLNACEGARSALNDQFAGTAQSLIQQGIPAVIAMQFRITDKASITLAHEFYGALADGYPVDAALTEARKAIKTEGNDLEWGTPVLYMRSPDGQIFDVAPLLAEAKPVPPVEPPHPVDSGPVRTGAGEARVDLSVKDTQWVVDPGRSVAIPVTVLNQGTAAGNFQVALSGIPSGWVTLPPAMELRPGQRKDVTLSIQPPRAPESRAGSYPVTLSVTGEGSTPPAAGAEITLIVQPFSSFSSRLLPEKIRAGKTARISIENQGNHQQAFTLDFQDRGGELAFQPPQIRVQVKEGQTAGAEFQALPKKRRLTGKEQVHPITVQVRPEKGEPQTLAGEVISRGLIPAWMLPVAMLITAAVTALICFVLVLPLLTQPKAPVIEVWEVSPPRIVAGEQVVIAWRVSNAESVEIQPFGPQGPSGRLSDTPQASKTYTLIARNKDKVVTRPLTVAVSGPVPPVACVPSLIIPDQGMVIDNGRTDKMDDIEWDFAWTECPGAAAYQLYVTSPTAAIPVIDDSRISVTGYHHIGRGSYIADANRFNWTWKVRAMVDGRWGDWSETRTFDVEPVNSDPGIAPPPSGACIPELLFPARDTVMDNGRMDNQDKEIWEFDWTDCPGAAAYQLYVIGPTATIPIIDENNIPTSSFSRVSDGYIVDANRFGWTWKVRALMDGQWGDWSETRRFDVEPPDSDPPTAP